MRPVKKVNAGQSVNFINSRNLVESIVVKASYSDYGEAKKPLIGNLGNYCSYCELCKDYGDLHVEHLSPKTHGGTNDWDNFLLSCNVCNSVKGHPDNISLSDFHWPHINNTFISFVYDCSGRVFVNPQLTGTSKAHAERLYEWLKLGRNPQGPSFPTTADYRWRKRYETWNKASEYKDLLAKGKTTVDEIIKDAKIYGCWSIWFTVFDGYPDVRKALIEDFEGTDKVCFNQNNGYAPVFRKPANTIDPV